MPGEVLGVGTTATSGGMVPEAKTFYSKQLLARLVPALEYANHGLAEDIGPHQGRWIEKRRFESYNPNTTILTEGTNPGPIQGTWTAQTFTICQYGAFTFVSDLLVQQGFDGIDDMINAFGENAGNSIDQVIRDSITSGGTVYYAGAVAGRTSLTAGSVMTATEVRKSVRKLRANNAKPFDDGYYHGLIHPDVEFDLQADTFIQAVYEYAAERGEDNPLIQGAVPAVFGAKFFRTTNGKTWANSGLSANVTVYGTVFLGRDAYLVSRFSTQNVRTIIKAVGESGPLDPLDQIGSIGWKASVAAGVLQANAIVRVESASSVAGT